jgi:hypothetical protein
VCGALEQSAADLARVFDAASAERAAS